MQKKLIICILFGLFFFSFNNKISLASLTGNSAGVASTKIKSLGRVPDGYTIIQESLKYSDDMKHVSYVMINDKKENFIRLDDATSRSYYAVRPGTPFFSKKQYRHAYIAFRDKNNLFVAVDGDSGPEFNAIDNLGFSPDENHFAYRAVKGDFQCVVIDHKPGPFYDGIPIKKNIGYSPDSKHFAYVAYFKEKNQCTFVLDGKELNTYKFIENVEFSPDSKQYAYIALIEKQGKNERRCVVYNGRESEVYDKIFSIVFSPDSKHFAFAALKGRRMALVVDNKESLYDRVGIPVFSQDSKRLAYAFTKNDNWYINVDGEDGPKLDGLIWFFFSPDSSKFAYTAIKSNKQYCYINNLPGPEFDKISAFTFSPDSKRYAYAGADEKGSKIVVDGKPGYTYSAVNDPKFSPDSKKIFYKAFLPSPYAWFTVLNGEKYGRAFYSIEDYFISPDSQHIAYRGMIEHGKITMVVDNKIHEEYQVVGAGYFSPDSNHISYHAMKVVGEDKKEKWHLVVDGIQLPDEYGGFILGTPILYDSDDRFHTIALRSPGPEFLHVEVTIPETWKIKSGI